MNFSLLQATSYKLPALLWRHRIIVALLITLAVLGTEFYALKIPKANAAYTIANSARFISGNSDYLSRTPGVAGNRTTGTVSVWVKRSGLGAQQFIATFGNTSSDTNTLFFGFTSSDQVYLSGQISNFRISNAVFRDPSAWYHFVLSVDTTQATAANRLRVYVNGTEITSWSTDTPPAQNANTGLSVNASSAIGRNNVASNNYLDGYLADFYYIDGAQLAPTCFGATDSNGYWRPITYSTASPCAAYGTNGFHLAFGNGNALGTDTGSTNNFATSTNFAATDQVTDSPTNSFATFTPIDQANITLSTGNLKQTATGADYYNGRATMFVNSGKWYWEETVNNVEGTQGLAPLIGIASPCFRIDNATMTCSPAMYGYEANGQKFVYNPSHSPSAYGSSFTANDVIGVAFDADAGTLTFYKNNVSQGTAFTGLSGYWGPSVRHFSSSAATANFGQGGQSGLTFDSASGGTFKYTPPAGFKALSTANLPAPTIAVPKNYFDAVAYTGTGAAQNVFQTGTSTTVTGFTPDLVWLKDRTSLMNHALFDSARGVQNWISSNLNSAEVASSTTLTVFASNGFTLGAATDVNKSGDNFISWLWRKCPTATVGCGSIADGVDIVTYSGDGTSNRAIAHSLGAAPDMVIVKRRDSTSDWFVWHSSMSSSSAYALLDSTAATSTTNSPWCTTCASTNWGASTFMVTNNATNNANAASPATYVAYLFKKVSGFSDFGSYTGNGSADGPFVYTGFKPRYVMFKRTDTAGNWFVYDTARDTYNVAAARLHPDLTNAETSASPSSFSVDFLSNGFKLRGSDSLVNALGGTYLYAAFADVPFYYSAQPAASAASGFVQAIAFLMGMTF